MVGDDRSVKPMSASMMRCVIATRMVAELYQSSLPLMSTAIRLTVEAVPGQRPGSGPPHPFTFAVSPFTYSGFTGARLVGTGKIDIGFMNPSAVATLAYLGKRPYRRAYPIRALGVHPSWDRMVLAVDGSLGIRTMAELKQLRPALRISMSQNDCTAYAAGALLRAHGLSLAELARWGGSVEYTARPSSPRRLDGIRHHEVNAVLDEGLGSFGQAAVDAGFVYLDFEPKALDRLERMGFKRAPLGPSDLPGMPETVTVIDYSGWPIITHDRLPEPLGYDMAGLLDRFREVFPYDQPEPPPAADLCRDTPDGPLAIPLHPGAERYYREKGYLP